MGGGGLVVVNCYMGLSRSASCVLAYLITKQDMSLIQVIIGQVLVLTILSILGFGSHQEKSRSPA